MKYVNIDFWFQRQTKITDLNKNFTKSNNSVIKMDEDTNKSLIASDFRESSICIH